MKSAAKKDKIAKHLREEDEEEDTYDPLIFI